MDYWDVLLALTAKVDRRTALGAARETRVGPSSLSDNALTSDFTSMTSAFEVVQKIRGQAVG